MISVVIPTLNEEKYIKACITALKNQTFHDFEVIAVDKNSTDATRKLCRTAGWQVITQKGRTISAARGEGFATARGEIIASTDADSAPGPRWLENISACFADPAVVCAYGPTYLMDKDFFSIILGRLNTAYTLLNRWFGNDQTPGMNFAVRKTAYQKIGGYNPLLPTAEDIDLGYRIRHLGKIVFHPGIVVYTSNRRLKAQKMGFFVHHFFNNIRYKLTGTASSDFKPIR
jgi:glycosyltransferase involved in cell wall biosynthesis